MWLFVKRVNQPGPGGTIGVDRAADAVCAQDPGRARLHQGCGAMPGLSQPQRPIRAIQHNRLAVVNVRKARPRIGGENRAGIQRAGILLTAIIGRPAILRPTIGHFAAWGPMLPDRGQCLARTASRNAGFVAMPSARALMISGPSFTDLYQEGKKPQRSARSRRP